MTNDELKALGEMYRIRAGRILEGEFKTPPKPEKKELVIHGHPIAVMDPEKAERIKQDVELNKSLGLDGQIELLGKEVLNADIDTLVSSKEYPEVNENGLKKIFGIDNLNPKVWGVNAWLIGKALAYHLSIPVALFILCYYLSEGTTEGEKVIKPGFFILSLLVGLASVIAAIVHVSSICGSDVCREMVPSYFHFRWLSLGMVYVPHDRCTVKIPYGAKLRLKEAMDTKIFSKYMVAYPKVTLNELPVRKLEIDPALIGVTEFGGEERWFLISLWDIEKDRDRVINDISRMKKLKV